ncbi:MAG: DUF1552 domain-containing protein [Sandaracinaceae bacterium]
MTPPRAFPRRRFLWGAGSVAIALPVAWALPRSGHAAPGRAPRRYVSLYFGNGMPKKFTDDGYTGVIAPLAPFADKLAMIRGLRLPEGSGASLHYKGTARFGKGVSARGESSAGGESFDNALYRDRGAGTRLLNVNMHTHVTGGNPATRWFHSWRGPNQPNDELLRPIDVFDEVFGSFMPPEDPGGGGEGLSAAERRAIRYRNSVLDSVLEQYREIGSERAGYPAEVRRRLADHLELVRSLERRSVDMMDPTDPPPPAGECAPPERPPGIEPSQACTPELCPADDRQYYGTGGANWNEVWALNAEIYATALRCGVVRFGTLGCTGGGDRYPIPELRAEGITESPHILAHDWRRDRENGFDVCVHWIMDKVALFLGFLDAAAWPEEGGGTVLDDTLVLLGTEMGTSRDGQHHGDWMTYWLAGGGGRVRAGDHVFEGRTDVDLYSTVARAMELGERFGDPADFEGAFDLVE